LRRAEQRADGQRICVARRHDQRRRRERRAPGVGAAADRVGTYRARSRGGAVAPPIDAHDGVSGTERADVRLHGSERGERRPDLRGEGTRRQDATRDHEPDAGMGDPGGPLSRHRHHRQFRAAGERKHRRRRGGAHQPAHRRVGHRHDAEGRKREGLLGRRLPAGSRQVDGVAIPPALTPRSGRTLQGERPSAGRVLRGRSRLRGLQRVERPRVPRWVADEGDRVLDRRGRDEIGRLEDQQRVVRSALSGRTRTTLVALMLFAVPSVGPAQTPARDTPATEIGTAVIRGRVIAAAGERPLAKVEVRAVAGEQHVNKTVLTDGNGRFQIGNLPAGRYVVTTARQNYVSASFGQRRPLGPGTPIDVAAGQIVSRIDFVLERTAAISGRILDEFGDPAPGAQVTTGRYAFVNGERIMQSAGATASTNDLGEYRLSGLRPGQYFVAATLAHGTFADTSDRTAYLATFYPGSGNPAEAQRIRVTAGQTVSGVNMALQPVIGSRISGIALDSHGQPMANASVNLMSRTGYAFGASGSSQARYDGTFTISGIPPGEYRLRANSFGQVDEVAAADVSVSGGDLTDVQVVVTRPSTVRGRLVFADDGGQRPAASMFRVLLTHPADGGMWSGPGWATARNDGTVDAKTRPGRATIDILPTSATEWRLRRVLAADGADVTDSGFDVPTNATVEGITVELTTTHNEISGTVAAEDGSRLRDCTIVIFTQDAQRWGLS